MEIISNLIWDLTCNLLKSNIIIFYLIRNNFNIKYTIWVFYFFFKNVCRLEIKPLIKVLIVAWFNFSLFDFINVQSFQQMAHKLFYLECYAVTLKWIKQLKCIYILKWLCDFQTDVFCTCLNKFDVLEILYHFHSFTTVKPLYIRNPIFNQILHFV